MELALILMFILGLMTHKCADFFAELMIAKMYGNGSHHCHFCEVSFLDHVSINYEYCPYCGRPLSKF